MSTYLETVHDVYRRAAGEPEEGLCCTTTPVWRLPGLRVPGRMLKMNYGCGATVHPRDLDGAPDVLYVGVGGGMELLQFAWFSRRQGAVTGVDAVPEMLEACRANFVAAEAENPWFRSEFVDLREGHALELPLEAASVDVAAQNCLFNIFRPDDLRKALAEMYRVLKPHGRLVMSDPVCDRPIPDRLRENAQLRARCLSGAVPVKDYVAMLTGAGFGTVEIRARRPYRILDPARYGTARAIYVESLEVAAIKDPMPEDGPCVFTGKAAIYYGPETSFDDGKGHILLRDRPVAVCDKTAAALAGLGREDIHVTDSTWFYDGGGCC